MKTKMLSLLMLVSMPGIYSQNLFAMEDRWNLNDVSYLLQLPKGDAQAPIGLLAPQDQGIGGPLLPEEVYRKIPTLLVAGNGNPTLYRNALRVVSVRIDPCPGMTIGACRPEMRLVWQPIEYDRYSKQWTARDAAVHCRYNLPEADFEDLKRDLWEIKLKYAGLGARTRHEALSVHPAIKNDDTAASFTADIQAVILRHAGSRNLSKVAFTALLVPTRWWRFGVFERAENGRWEAADIPRVDMPNLDIFNVAVEDGIGLGLEKGLDAILNILPEEYPESDNIFAVINKGYRFNDDRDQTVFEGKLDAIARFQNPPPQTNLWVNSGSGRAPRA